MSSLPEFSMRQLIEAGVHYGHQAHRWNPLMAEFIHSKKNGIHIIDLTKTVPMLDLALKTVMTTVAKGGNVLFVGTKRQAQKPIKDAAVASAQFYINQRWLGGTLTNWKTVSNSIQRLNSIDEKLDAGIEGLTKKELLGMRREQAKLQASLGGIRAMKGLPSLLFVIDVNKEAIAIAEAAKLGIPVIAVVDTNCQPHQVEHIVPGNDDAARAITLYCDLVSRAAIAGLQKEIGTRDDLGEAVDGYAETVVATNDDAKPRPQTEEATATENSDAAAGEAEAFADGKEAKTAETRELVSATPAEEAKPVDGKAMADTTEKTGVARDISSIGERGTGADSFADTTTDDQTAVDANDLPADAPQDRSVTTAPEEKLSPENANHADEKSDQDK